MLAASVTADRLRDVFETPAPLTVGLEEELMLLDRDTLDLSPRAPEVLACLVGDARFKPEMPAAQLEIVTGACATVGEAAADLAAARLALAVAAPRQVLPAGAGAHPFASGMGELNPGKRYDAIQAEYGDMARRQLAFGLHVHAAVRGGDRALAVYNGLRPHLPELAVLAGNAPFHEGRDTGLASVRPTICDLLPRQGIPPAFESWEALAAELRWGAAAGSVPDARRWWWELRLHPAYGTVEVRVPDTQSTVADTAAVAAVVHALIATLVARHDAGEPEPAVPRWRIGENRWSAYRHGLDGTLADLETGERTPTRERLAALLEEIAPAGAALGCETELAAAGGLIRENGSMRQRTVASERGVRGLAGWLADRFVV